MLDAITRTSSYFGFLGTSVATTINGVTSFAQGVLALGKSHLSPSSAPKAQELFSYCVYPAGSNQAAKILCSVQKVLLHEFNALVNTCQASLAPDRLCDVLDKLKSYSPCDNRTFCNLLYNGSINTCFDSVLNATVPSSCVTRIPGAPNPWAGVPIIGLGVIVVGCVACIQNKSKIADYFKRCCPKRYDKIRTVEIEDL